MTSRRQRLTLALLVAFALAGLLVVVLQSSQARRSADFTIDYSAATLIREGHPAAIYERQQLGPLMLRLSDRAIDPRLPFDAPLALALPFVPLSLLPLEVAFHAWQVITVALLLLALGLLARWFPLAPRARWLGLLALLAFPATWALLSEGQSSALLVLGAVLLVGAWRRDLWLLGAGGGVLLAMKPHYLPVYLILLLAAGRWKSLLGAVCGCILVGLSPLVAGGFPGMAAMVFSALDSGQGVIRYNESLIGSLAPLLPGAWATYVGFAIWALVLIALGSVAVMRLIRRGSTAGREIGLAVALTSAGLLFAPHALPYDLVLLAVPAWLTYALHREGLIADPSPAWMIVGLVLLLDLHASPVPLTPVALAGVIGWTQGQTKPWRQSREQRPPLAEAG